MTKIYDNHHRNNGGGRTEIDCEAAEAARVMQAIYNAGKDGMLRIEMSNSKKEIIINTKHLIKAFATYPQAENQVDK